MWPDDDDTPEPSAWINFNAATRERNVSFVCESELASIPLWPEPPRGQRKPLTPQEVDAIWATKTDIESVVRAVEKAHGIGGES